MSQILDCKLVADQLKEEVKQEVALCKEQGILPKLALLRVGEKGPDLSYEKSILTLCEELGIAVDVHAYPANLSQEEYIRIFQGLNEDPSVFGVLPFRPLDHIDETLAIGQNTNPKKDIDAGTDANLGKVLLDDRSGLLPCTPAAILSILDFYGYDVKGKHVVLINNSNVFGKPLALLLTNRFATVTVCHEFTKDLSSFTRQADLLITAVPVEQLITEDMISEDVTLIDATVIRRVVDGKVKILGCLSDGAKEKAFAYTPVPGVGKVTSVHLMKNLLKSCKEALLEQ